MTGIDAKPEDITKEYLKGRETGKATKRSPTSLADWQRENARDKGIEHKKAITAKGLRIFRKECHDGTDKFVRKKLLEWPWIQRYMSRPRPEKSVALHLLTRTIKDPGFLCDIPAIEYITFTILLCEIHPTSLFLFWSDNPSGIHKQRSGKYAITKENFWISLSGPFVPKFSRNTTDKIKVVTIENTGYTEIDYETGNIIGVVYDFQLPLEPRIGRIISEKEQKLRMTDELFQELYGP